MADNLTWANDHKDFGSIMYKSTMEKQNQFGGVRVHSYDL
jgi:hypothetical protein